VPREFSQDRGPSKKPNSVPFASFCSKFLFSASSLATGVRKDRSRPITQISRWTRDRPKKPTLNPFAPFASFCSKCLSPALVARPWCPKRPFPTHCAISRRTLDRPKNPTPNPFASFASFCSKCLFSARHSFRSPLLPYVNNVLVKLLVASKRQKFHELVVCGQLIKQRCCLLVFPFRKVLLSYHGLDFAEFFLKHDVE
jgi:hypothetical protein